MHIRGITRADFLHIVKVLDDWWGGPSPERASPIFYYELGEHALIAEENDDLVGFLLGFITPSHEIGYVHLVGIHPERRRHGVGQALYRHFADSCRAAGARRLKSISTVGHESSARFHRALGFKAEEQPDYAGPGRSRVVFTLELNGPA